MDTLPCGCKMDTVVENGVNTLLFIPCSFDCTYYLYVLEESAKQGNTIEKRFES